ncbi:acetyltransferase [Saccharomonospora azurea NA-128]|uniref:Acetyltransferase n=2 Tax=Saccharomonospora azurea TaxID=40988 RepID=H8G553_9PSEU|nr:acetyltransferase [Saccharomonospora azurea NA-128]
MVCSRDMTITLSIPAVGGLPAAVDALRHWQDDDAPWQLHPGDVGWYWRFGADATAAALRTWRRGARILAVGLQDGPALLRLALAPDALRDEELAHRLVDDLGDPRRGVLPDGPVSLEAPANSLVRDLLPERGWSADESWTSLRHDLTQPVPDPGVRVEVVGREHADVRAAVQRAAFSGSTFTAERWHAMASGVPYSDARCLLAFDGDKEDDAVAVVTVWSAGPGRPGLVEPMGVHQDHRGRGHGRAITVAAVAALVKLGASSAIVATPTANVGALATYTSAGFRPRPDIRDLRRDA